MDVIAEVQVARSVGLLHLSLVLLCGEKQAGNFDGLSILCDFYIYSFQLDMLALYFTERQSPAPPAKFKLIKCWNSPEVLCKPY